MAKKIMLITGSSGRIGRACVHAFADEYQIIGFDRHKIDHVKEMDHLTMDVSSDESVEGALKTVKERYGSDIDVVIHLAAYYSFSESRPELYEKITVKGTERLLKQLQLFRVQQFIFSSTLLVHAPCAIGETIDENWPLKPAWDYPKSKVATEQVIHRERGNIPAVILRIAGCYDDQCHSIPIAHNIQRIYERELEAHLYPGDPSHGNPFLHMDDLVEAIRLTIQRRDTLPKEIPILIGEDKTASYKLLQNRISELLNHEDFSLYRIPKWMAKVGAEVQDHLLHVSDDFIQPWMIDIADDHYALNVSKAKEMLGWQPRHYVLDVLPTMLELLKKDPVAWYETNELTPPEWLLQGQKKYL